MAKHEVVIHENTSATKEVAPYLGSYISKETIREGVFANTLATLCGMSAVQVMAILDGSFEAIEELELSGLVRVHTDVGTVCGVITGSFPTADAAFDRAQNSLELALRLDDEVKLALSDLVPYIAQDESLTKLRVDNVMDLATPKPYNLIHGQGVFRVAGFNMVLDDEGAAVYLEESRGATFPLVIDEVVSKQLFKAHTASLLPAGDYKLVVKSRAGDAGGPLQTSFRKVKYMRIAPPFAVDAIGSEGHEGEIVRGAAFAATGSDLRFDAAGGDTVKVKWSEGGEAKEISVTPTATTPEKMDFAFPDDLAETPDDTELVFEFTLGGADARTKGAKLVGE